jgi:hypothetical protein
MTAVGALGVAHPGELFECSRRIKAQTPRPANRLKGFPGVSKSPENRAATVMTAVGALGVTHPGELFEAPGEKAFPLGEGGAFSAG